MAGGAREIIERRGPLTLARTGGVWEILWDGMFLMSSQCRESERALGALGRGRTLVGGLGMGLTLRAALDAGATAVDVVEIAGVVIEWNRGPLAALAGRPLADPRVRVHEADVAAFAGAARAGEYDAILLDVDNGPSWTARPENGALYTESGLFVLRGAFAPGGVLAIWSAQREPALAASFAESAQPSPVAGHPDYLYVLRVPVTPAPRCERGSCHRPSRGTLRYRPDG